DKLEMHDLMCYIRLSEAANLASDTKATLMDKLKRVVENTVERDPEKWKEYGLPPLTLIASPDSPFAASFSEAIQKNLDVMIDGLNEDGSWKPNWSWFGSWPETWEQASRDWAGFITLDNLRRLKAFGRLA